MNVDGLECTISLLRRECFPMLIAGRRQGTCQRAESSINVNGQEISRSRQSENQGKARVTHFLHNGTIDDTRHRVLDVLLDESTVPRVTERGSGGAGVGRTRFTKLDDFIAEDKVERQDMHGT